MVSISGIRGIIGDSLTPAVTMRYASAFAEYCRNRTPGNTRIVIGRDGRMTGPMVADIIEGTLVAKGMAVINLGIATTPTVQLAVEHSPAAGGIAITASHNPMEWNGMKFVAPSGMFLDAEENHEFWRIAEHSQGYVPWDHIGSLEQDQTWPAKHIDAVLSQPLFNIAAIRQRGFTVVLDCINASGGTIVPSLLERLGCTVIPMNCEVSGVFARTPEPIPENLGAVAERVRAEHADLGIVVDPDVDRLVLINERGEPYGEEYTIATAVDFVLHNMGMRAVGSTVVVNLSTSRAVEDIASRYGARCLRTPVGEINVAKRMSDEHAVIGGEGSGGVILPAVHLGRDAIVGIALVLQSLAASGGTLSALKASLPQYQIAKGKVPLGVHSADEVVHHLERLYGKDARVNKDDGIKFDFPDYWVHLRKSNTEPIIRIIAEAATFDQARDAVEHVTHEISAVRG